MLPADMVSLSGTTALTTPASANDNGIAEVVSVSSVFGVFTLSLTPLRW